MGEQVTPGLTADWLNAWLAAIGITVLVPEVRLAWTHDLVPKARFCYPDGHHLAELVAESLPGTDELERLAIAGLPQNVPADRFRETAAAARPNDDLSLGILTTDVAGNGKGEGLPTGPFNVGAPRGETLFTRLRACRRKLDSPRPLADLVRATLDGRGERHETNGLGFDYRRIAASVPGEAAKKVDPVIECLCFYGLHLHPLGVDHGRLRQRGWLAQPTRPHSFQWPTWTASLDRWAIDALLDLVYRDTRRMVTSNGQRRRSRIPPHWRRFGVTALYGSVPFKQVGSSDTTRGYGSERLA